MCAKPQTEFTFKPNTAEQWKRHHLNFSKVLNHLSISCILLWSRVSDSRFTSCYSFFFLVEKAAACERKEEFCPSVIREVYSQGPDICEEKGKFILKLYWEEEHESECMGGVTKWGRGRLLIWQEEGTKLWKGRIYVNGVMHLQICCL